MSRKSVGDCFEGAFPDRGGAQAVEDLEAQNSIPQKTSILPVRIVGQDEDQIDIGNASRESADGRAAEKDHAEDRTLSLGKDTGNRVEISLNVRDGSHRVRPW